MELTTEKYLSDDVKDLYEQERHEQERYEQEADSEPHPWVYIHERCGHATEMPGHIRDNYLADPYFYFMGTICAHCGGGVPESHVFWMDTGECLADYMRRLKQTKSRAYHAVRYLLPVFAAMCLTVPTAIDNFKAGDPPSLAVFIVVTLVYAAIAWLPCRFFRLFLCRMNVI